MVNKYDLGNLITSETIILFDMDGTLIDTDYANYLSYHKAICTITKNNYGLNYNPNERFNRSQLKRLIPNLSNDDYEKIIKEKEMCYLNYLHELKLKKEVFDILIKYSGTNRTVLVTNCRKERVFITLDYFDLTDKFSNIICRTFNETFMRVNKYEYAVSQLNIPINSVVVIENEEIEMIDAMNIGIPAQKVLKF